MNPISRSILLTFLAAVFAAPLLAQCECPTVSVRPNFYKIKAGGTVEFYVTSSDTKLMKGPFRWTVSKGEIVSGQGTSRILMRLPADTPTKKKVPETETSPQSTPTNNDIPPGFVASSLPQAGPIPYSPPRNRQLTATVTLPKSRSCSCPTASFSIEIEALVASSPIQRGGPPALINEPADVQELKLGRTQIYSSCAPGAKPPAGGSNRVIDVSTIATDAENDVLTYHYSVRAGRIVGQGAHVTWDLDGVEPGAYTITAAVDDGCGLCGATKTQTIDVIECSVTDIECPSVDMAGPDTINPQAVVGFTAKISGGGQHSVTYTWSVTNGEIIEGQGSPSVKVKMPADIEGNDVSVTVRFGGLDPRGNCIDSVTKEFHNARVKP